MRIRAGTSIRNRPFRTSEAIYDRPWLVIGHFQCPSSDRAWGTENRIGSRPLVVFPRVPVRIQHADKPGVVADPNCVMFYNAEQCYRRHLLDDRGDVCEFFGLDERVLAEIMTDFDRPAADEPGAMFEFSNGPSDAALYLHQRQICQYVRLTQEPDDVLVQESVILIIQRVVEQAFRARGIAPQRRRAETDRVHRDSAESAKEFLARRFDRRLSLADVADATHLSPFHLCRIFRRQTGSTLHQYLTQLRLRSSLEFLAEARIDLTDLALQLGYSSHAHFTSAFSRAFGVSPSQVRDGRGARRLIDQMSKKLKAERPTSA